MLVNHRPVCAIAEAKLSLQQAAIINSALHSETLQRSVSEEDRIQIEQGCLCDMEPSRLKVTIARMIRRRQKEIHPETILEKLNAWKMRFSK